MPSLLRVLLNGSSKPVFSPTLDAMANGSIAGIRTPVIIGAVVFGAMWVLLNRTVFGRNVYAVGSNPAYPFALGTVGSITSSSVAGANATAYYYFFYDWEVQRPLISCESIRTEVIVEVAPQGINDGTVAGFSVYPVPTSALLTIDFGTLAGEVDMDLMDLTGRVVSAEHRAVKGNSTIDVSDLARGEYTLRVRHDNGLVVRRIVVR
mgnify:CR=1 FL=1